MLQMGVHTHLITCRAAIPLMLRTAAAHGTSGLVIEMTDGTSAANADAYGVTDTDGSRPDCRGYLAEYGWERDDGEGVDRFR